METNKNLESGNRSRTNRQKHTDRITLKADALEKVEAWLNETNQKFKGIKLTRSDLVNWLVLSHIEKLSDPELEQIRNLFFDEVRFALWALNEIRSAKARGESASLAEIIANNSAKNTLQNRTTRKKKLQTDVIATNEMADPAEAILPSNKLLNDGQKGGEML